MVAAIAVMIVELMMMTLDNLEQPDILSAARVSKRWRAVAVENSYYYCSLRLVPDTSPPWSVSWAIKVASFCNTVQNCVRRDITLECFVHDDYSVFE